LVRKASAVRRALHRSDSGRAYDVLTGRLSFLMIKENATAWSSLAARGILVYVNWFEDVRSKLAQARRCSAPAPPTFPLAAVYTPEDRDDRRRALTRLRGMAEDPRVYGRSRC
jgi:hypothetical protein